MYLVPYPTAAGVGEIPQIKSIYNYKDYNILCMLRSDFCCKMGYGKSFFKGFWILLFQRRVSRLIIANLYCIIAV